ncbi:MAG: enoyl-CoA hydratase-related protein [Ornithinimicrobium sp.]
MMAERGFLQVTRLGPNGEILEIALDRPGALNAISTPFAAQLAEVTAEVARDDSVRVVMLTSTTPRAFCVGADLKERQQMSDAEMLSHREISRGAYRGVLDLPMPTVAVVEGYALGGGLELALSCDLIVAAEQSVVGLPEVSVGLIPGGGGTQLLARKVGHSRAASMIFTAERQSASAAAELGVLDYLTPTGGARSRALQLAESIARNSPTSVRNAKSAMRRGLDADLLAGLEIEDSYWRATATSEDRREGISAFNEKRSPRWHPLAAERD